MQQPEKKIYRKAIIQYWNALPVNNDNVHIRLGLPKFLEACPALRTKLWGHWVKRFTGVALSNWINIDSHH
jgi:hypothetical protein